MAPVFEGIDGMPLGGWSISDSLNALWRQVRRLAPAGQAMPLVSAVTNSARTLDPNLIDDVISVLERAVQLGVPFRELMRTITPLAPADFQWPGILTWNVASGLKALRQGLRRAVVDNDKRLRNAVAGLNRQVEADKRHRT